MPDEFLIVSDPPQGEVDIRAAAPCFGLTPSAVGLKTKYPVPEIWVADQSRIRIGATAQTLRLAGHMVAVVPGRALLLPTQVGVASFRFGERQVFILTGDGRAIEIPVDAALVGVLCMPSCAAEMNSGAENGGGVARAITSGHVPKGMQREGRAEKAASSRPHPGRCQVDGADAFLDLYVPTSTGLLRLSFVENDVDFDGLESLAAEGNRDNLMALAGQCEEQFTNLRLDRRLVDMVPRQRPAAAEAANYRTPRRGYSFGSERLPRLLRRIDDGLDELSQFELSSRLAYLTVWQRSARDGSVH